MKGEREVEMRLIVPARLPVDDSKRSGRFTHAMTNEDALPVRVVK